MSALAHFTDSSRTSPDIREVPKADHRSPQDILPCLQVILSDTSYLLEPTLNVQRARPRILAIDVAEKTLKLCNFLAPDVLPNLIDGKVSPEFSLSLGLSVGLQATT